MIRGAIWETRSNYTVGWTWLCSTDKTRYMVA
nr:MAG TPA: hypothetical protein [Bacteriophage sp.]